MKYSQYAQNKDLCCSCKEPLVYSTEKDHCRRCKKSTYDETWSEYFTKQAKEILNQSALPIIGQELILKLITPSLQYISNDSDIVKARTVIENLKKRPKSIKDYRLHSTRMQHYGHWVELLEFAVDNF